MRDKARSHREAPRNGSWLVISHPSLPCLPGELAEDRFPLTVDRGFVRHHVFHSDAAVLTKLPVQEGALIRKLDLDCRQFGIFRDQCHTTPCRYCFQYLHEHGDGTVR